MSSFFKRGAAALDAAVAEQERRDAEREAQNGQPRRFWLGAPGKKGFKKGDNEADIIFLDDDVPVFDEHTVESGKGKYVQYTCLLNEEGATYCPVCEMGNTPTTVALFPIIDRRSFTNRDGTKTYTDQVRILVAKPRTLKQLRVFQSKLKTLVGVQFSVTRTDKQSAAVGDNFIADGTKHSKKEMVVILRASGVLKDDEGFDDALPDYESLAPLPVDELEAILGKTKDDSDDDDDDVNYD